MRLMTCVITEPTVFLRCLGVVAPLSHGLVVIRIPEQSIVAFVRHDVVHDISRQRNATLLTFIAYTEWMEHQELNPVLLPSAPVKTAV